MVCKGRTRHLMNEVRLENTERKKRLRNMPTKYQIRSTASRSAGDDHFRQYPHSHRGLGVAGGLRLKTGVLRCRFLLRNELVALNLTLSAMLVSA
jgi:hypothetical protein